MVPGEEIVKASEYDVEMRYEVFTQILDGRGVVYNIKSLLF